MADKNMPGFMIYRESAIMLSLITPQEAGETIQAVANYYLYNTEPSVSDRCLMIVDTLIHGVEQGREKWEKQREGGRKGNKARWEKSVSDSLPTTGHSVTNPNSISTSYPHLLSPSQIPSCSIPTLDEVREYAKERDSKANPDEFYDYNSVKGWVVNGESVKDWKALFRRWEKKESSKDGGHNQTPIRDDSKTMEQVRKLREKIRNG